MQLPNTLKTPFFLQTLQLIANPVRFVEKVAQQYPDIFTAKVSYTGSAFWENLVFINHPQGIEEILTNTNKFAAPGDVNKIMKPLLGEYSLVLLEGERHKQRRKLLMPCFYGDRMRRAYGQLIVNITEKVFGQLPIDTPFSARTAMQDIALQVILEAVFGLYEGERYQQLKRLITVMLEDVLKSPLTSSLLFFPFLQKDLGSWSPWGYFVRLQQQIYELLYAEIAQRREQPDPNRVDILSLLMSVRDEEGKPMTDQQLRDELLTLLVGGHESTATAMAWVLYWVHKKPFIREKLLQELHSLGDSPDPISIFRLPYLTAVCNESLRIHPVFPFTFTRVVKEPVELLGHLLEPGTLVVGCIHLTHQREDLYPNPQQFKPERFLERQFSPYEFLPFGGGIRRCIGEALALFEMKLVLATAISRYELALVDERPERPQRQRLTMAPGNGVKMVITGQRAPHREYLVTSIQ